MIVVSSTNNCSNHKLIGCKNLISFQWWLSIQKGHSLHTMALWILPLTLRREGHTLHLQSLPHPILVVVKLYFSHQIRRMFTSQVPSFPHGFICHYITCLPSLMEGPCHLISQINVSTIDPNVANKVSLDMGL